MSLELIDFRMADDENGIVLWQTGRGMVLVGIDGLDWVYGSGVGYEGVEAKR